jgi:hypothetical protein
MDFEKHNNKRAGNDEQAEQRNFEFAQSFRELFCCFLVVG